MATLSLDRRASVKRAPRAKSRVLRGSPLNYNAGVEQKYRDALHALVTQMTEQYRRELLRFFGSEHARKFFATDDKSVASGARVTLSNLEKKFSALFSSKAQGIASGMVDNANKASSSAVNSSLKKLAAGITLKTVSITPQMREIIKASTTYNAGLIKSIPREYHDKVRGAVMRSITTGNGLADLEPALDRYDEITTRRAKLIAKDQTRKVYADLNAGRMSSAGVDEYEWLHSAGDREPRPLHISYNGQHFSLKNPPVIQYAAGSLPEVRGKPGDLINCSCKMVPIVKFLEEPQE